MISGENILDWSRSTGGLDVIEQAARKAKSQLLAMTLYETPANCLDAWMEIHLQPSKFTVLVRDATNRIATFLKENCFQGQTTKVIKVVKGGSSGKGTYLKNGSDADLVVFLSCFQSLQDLSNVRGHIIEEIRKKLNICRKDIADKVYIPEPRVNYDSRGQLRQPRSLTFTIQISGWPDSVEVDVLPAFDILGQVRKGIKTDPEVYNTLINAGGGPGEFSPCFTELQRNFVKSQNTKLKSLIRLVKHWYKKYVKTKHKGVPHKYALELLTIYAWEQGSREDYFRTGEGFCTVLKLLCQYQNLCIYWTTNYDFQNQTVGNYIKEQLKKPRPVILDPADPTGIVGVGSRWDLVAAEAQLCLQSTCCKNSSGPVQAWDVKPSLPVPWLSQNVQSPVFTEQAWRQAVYNNEGRPVARQEESSIWSYCTIL